ncbi:MAG: hypothetical protein WC979_07355 [Candidatus Pacearchaeota archaeon]|jgi:hypothetical protein
MDLQNIVTDAAAGFSLGLILGLNKSSYTLERTLEFIEAVPEEKRKEFGIEEPATPEALKYIKKRISIDKTILPYLAGALYSAIDSVVTSQRFGENIVVSVPFAYLGNFVGRGIRKFKGKEDRRKIQTLKQVLDDPTNAEKYALSIDQRKRIDDYILEMETDILEGRGKKECEGNFSKICQVMSENPGPYTEILLQRSMKRVEDVVRRAVVQTKIRGFYDSPYISELEGCPEFLKEALLNREKPNAAEAIFATKPTEPKLEVFSKEEGIIYAQRFEWPDLKIIRRDGVPGFGVQGKSCLGKEEIFLGDYRTLAQRIAESEEQGYSAMLIKSKERIPERLKRELVTSHFMAEFEDYLRSQTPKSK